LVRRNLHGYPVQLYIVKHIEVMHTLHGIIIIPNTLDRWAAL